MYLVRQEGRATSCMRPCWQGVLLEDNHYTLQRLHSCLSHLGVVLVDIFGKARHGLVAHCTTVTFGEDFENRLPCVLYGGYNRRHELCMSLEHDKSDLSDVRQHEQEASVDGLQGNHQQHEGLSEPVSTPELIPQLQDDRFVKIHT